MTDFERRRTIRQLIVYFALAFGITFGLGAAVILARPQFEAVFGPLGRLQTSWVYYVGVCAPTISAILVAGMFDGLEGIRNIFRGLIRPFRLRWVFVALLTFPMAMLAWGFAERALFGGASPAVDIHALLVTAPLAMFTTTDALLDPGPWGEESGWRGFALPRLLSLFSPLTAAIGLGVIWAVWHTPAFLVSGLSQSNYNFGWFVLGTTCLSVVMAWIYVNAGRNYLVAGFIPHEINNRFFGYGVHDVRIQALLMSAVVLLIVIAFGPSLRGWGPARAAPAAP